MNLFKKNEKKPYTIKAILKEKSAVNPDTSIGVYVRYTELSVEKEAPETIKTIIDQCNLRAKEAATKQLALVTKDLSIKDIQNKNIDYRFTTYAYIVMISRADENALSILECEYEAGLWDEWKGNEVSYRFTGNTYDVTNGEKIELSDIVDENNIVGKLDEAIKKKYGISDLSKTDFGNYAWTADSLGIRFYFNSDAVLKEKREEINDHSDDVITVGLSYDVLDGIIAKKLAVVPEAYVAMIDLDTVYDLPYGDLSIMITKGQEGTYISLMSDNGKESSLSIEYADDESDYYIIRSHGVFYLFRQRTAYQEGFFYDFSKPDGGFGRFAYNNCQYIDNFIREIRLALAYDPYCIQMAEVKRSFGENSYDNSSFVPYGNYSLYSDENNRYKYFSLLDDSLKIDSLNRACRLLKDITAIELDEQGNEVKEITIKAGSSLLFESLKGEADRYQVPTKRGRNDITYVYDCRMSNGKMLRFKSNTETIVSVDKEFLGRFSESISLAEAGIDIDLEQPLDYTVCIGGKDYPLITDYSLPNHYGEEIVFGEDIWWIVEGYVGHYEVSDDDLDDMKENYIGSSALFDATLDIDMDGKVIFKFGDRVYEGTMPEKRYYGKKALISMKSIFEQRTFTFVLRDGSQHNIPSRIEFYSEGLPATNKPSVQPPMSVYLSKQ